MNAKSTTARHIRWQIILIVAGTALLAALLIYVALTFTTETVKMRGGTYVEGMVGQPHALNPLFSQFNDIDRDLCSLLFNGLMRLDGHGVPQPDLAARPAELSPDGLTYTVTLRSDVRWHDGQPFTADDVLFTINLLKAPNSLEMLGSTDLVELWRTVEVTRVHAYKLTFTLKEQFAPFPDYLTLGILPAHVLRQVQPTDLLSTDFNLHPIGTGPFKVEDVRMSHDQIDRVLLAANPYYFGNQPYLSKIEFKFFADDAAVFNAYRAGQVQGIARVSHTDLPRLRQYPRLDVFSAPLASYSLIFLNLTNPDVPFFQTRQVRQALFYALDRHKIVDQALDGNGIVVPGPILPDTWAFDPDLPIIQPDPDKARALLDAAGWTINPSSSSAQATSLPTRSKEGKLFTFTLLASNDPAHLAMAEAIAEQWAAIGISVTVKPAPMLVTHHLVPRSYEAVLIDLSLAGDPDPYPFWHETQTPGGQNYSGYKDRDMSEILEQARRTNDQNRRRELYRNFQKMFMEEIPAIPVCQPIYTFAVDGERVHGVQIGPLSYPSDRFYNVADWYIVTRRVIVSSR